MLVTLADVVIETLRTFVHGVVRGFVWNVVLFNLGRVFLLIGTGGRYPRGRALGVHANRISSAGVLVIALIWVGFFAVNNLSRTPN